MKQFTIILLCLTGIYSPFVLPEIDQGNALVSTGSTGVPINKKDNLLVNVQRRDHQQYELSAELKKLFLEQNQRIGGFVKKVSLDKDILFKEVSSIEQRLDKKIADTYFWINFGLSLVGIVLTISIFIAGGGIWYSFKENKQLSDNYEKKIKSLDSEAEEIKKRLHKYREQEINEIRKVYDFHMRLLRLKFQLELESPDVDVIYSDLRSLEQNPNNELLPVIKLVKKKESILNNDILDVAQRIEKELRDRLK